MKTYSNLKREERIKRVMEQRRQDIVLVLENLSEELNISAILRTAEAFGISKIFVIHLENKKPKLSRNTSSGATKWIDVEFSTSTEEVLKRLKSEQYEIIATIVDPEAQLLWTSDLTGKIVIVMGNEAQGISETVIKMSDKKLYLPMFGLTESLNVSVATALFLYEAIRQKEINKQ